MIGNTDSLGLRITNGTATAPISAGRMFAKPGCKMGLERTGAKNCPMASIEMKRIAVVTREDTATARIEIMSPLRRRAASYS